MALKDIEFLASYETLSDFKKRSPHATYPQIAIVGRSNVGKSSLINHLFQNKHLARVSKKPGKTRLLNFFKTPKFLLVDLPGYGFAIPNPLRKRWAETIDNFLSNNEQLSCLLFLLDIRRNPNEDDLLMYRWLVEKNVRFFIVFTKSDKLSKSQIKPRSEEILQILSPEKTINPVHYSIFDKTGKEILTKKIQNLWD